MGRRRRKKNIKKVLCWCGQNIEQLILYQELCEQQRVVLVFQQILSTKVVCQHDWIPNHEYLNTSRVKKRRKKKSITFVGSNCQRQKNKKYIKYFPTFPIAWLGLDRDWCITNQLLKNISAFHKNGQIDRIFTFVRMFKHSSVLTDFYWVFLHLKFCHLKGILFKTLRDISSL